VEKGKSIERKAESQELKVEEKKSGKELRA